MADFVFKQSRNTFSLIDSAQEAVGNVSKISSEALSHTPQLIEETTQDIEKISNRIVSSTQSTQKEIINTVPRFTQGFIRNIRSFGEDFRITFLNIPKSVIAFAKDSIKKSINNFNELSQRNEYVKKRLKYNIVQLPQITKELYSEATSYPISDKFYPIYETGNQTVNKIVKSLKNTPNLLQENFSSIGASIKISSLSSIQGIKEWGINQLSEITIFAYNLPNSINQTIDNKINQTFQKLSNIKQSSNH